MVTETAKAMTEGQFRTVTIKLLTLIEQELGSDVPVSTVLLLLHIPAQGAISMAQLVKLAHLTPAGVSRTVATLAGIAKTNRRSVEKPLATLEDDPKDRRYKMVGLTEYGRQFVASLLSVGIRYA